jgi:hypothetical protein
MHPLSNAFESIDKISSSAAQTDPSSLLVQPPIATPVAKDNNPVTSSTIVPSSMSTSTSPLVSSQAASTSNVTMTISNNLPTFKGLANERPIQFLNDFELRASALVGNDDTALLKMIQQSLSEGALIWFGQLQKSFDRIMTWSDFKVRFSERYHTSIKTQNLRTELRLLFQGDHENILDYFDRLKALMHEIDPEGSENWLKHKFIQKLRFDIRARLDIDTHLPVRDIVRKAQLIESNIEQQKLDEKFKSAIRQEKRNLTSFTTNNLSVPSDCRQQSPTGSNTQSFVDNNYRHRHNNTNATDDHQHTYSSQRRDVSPRTSYPTSNRSLHSNSNFHSSRPNSVDATPVNPTSLNQRTRWWCQHCQRSGHSWERCPHNPEGVNYRRNSSSVNPALSSTTSGSTPSSRSSSFHRATSSSQGNDHGR